jgi:CRP/FNR family transcriptional regulator
MIDEDLLREISVALPFMQAAPQEFITDLKNHSLKLAFQKGQQILHEDDLCQYLPIVLSGDLRVYRTHSSGREVTLYHISRGESCFLTMNCIFLNQLFPATARAEEYSEALMVPATAMQRWRDKFPFWQKYIFEVAASRLISVISVLSDIAFARMDERVAQFLAQRWRETGQSELQVTHQEIANELGTAREVVTRVLRSLEEQGIVTLTRGSIKLANMAALSGQKTLPGGD